MTAQELFDLLWQGYTKITPTAKNIHDLFESRGENILNDHIALRTFNDPRVCINVLEKPFIAAGYKPCDEYVFEQKKLKARHYELPEFEKAPKIFISELELEKVSPYIKETVTTLLDSVDPTVFNDPLLVTKGRVWGECNWEIFEKLRSESEYASWMYAYGFMANHFTVNVNELKTFKSLQEVNDFLEASGYKLNASGGKIKGTPEQLLEQSSILADLRSIAFTDGAHEIPSCYYEFALRYPMADGKLYQGFIAASADKIFESTDLKLRMNQ